MFLRPRISVLVILLFFGSDRVSYRVDNKLVVNVADCFDARSASGRSVSNRRSWRSHID